MNESEAAPSALRSRDEFERAVEWALRHALSTRVRRLTLLDRDFGAWPLSSAALLDTLAEWVRLPQRRLVLIAYRFALIERQHPRFVAWRRDWSHAVEAWSPSAGVQIELPTLLIDDSRLCLQLFDSGHWRGRLSLDEHAVRQWGDEIDALLQRCEPAFPVQHLGL